MTSPRPTLEKEEEARGRPLENVEMAAAWDGEEGEGWARDWERYDRSIRRYQERLLIAAAVAPGEHVLDVGCGNGESTRAAARASQHGAALGVDLSTRMLERARQLAVAEGVSNASFEVADAQVHPFRRDAYDVVISRFGAMFFSDPGAAFANLCEATRRGGRLAVLAWQDFSRNEWLKELRSALAVGRDLPSPPSGIPGPFGLADPETTEAVLQGAGYREIDISAVEEPTWAGADAGDAYAFFSKTGMVRGLIEDLDEAARMIALESLKEMLKAHEGVDGVELGSAAWLITARKGP